MTGGAAAFYDAFSRRFLEDLVGGNRRIDRQLALLSSAVPPDVQAVLVVGCGSGQSARHVATLAPRATVTGVDVSGECQRIAQALFAHPRVTYRTLDVTAEVIEGTYDVVVLPDVYEHIPVTSRPRLHAQLARVLASRGRIILTLPSPAHQALLRQKGEGLQVVDETVTLEDLTTLARDVQGTITYYNVVSVWGANDYVHAVIERGADVERPIVARDRLPLKGWTRRERLAGVWHAVGARTGALFIFHRWRRWRLRRRLAAAGGPRPWTVA